MTLFPFDEKKAMYIPTVLIMCGPPASGKTTFIKKKLSKAFTVLSRDAIRDFWYGPGYKPSRKAEDAVTVRYNQLLCEYIAERKYIVVDKTNCDEQRMLQEIFKFETNGYIVFIKFFEVSYPMLIFREIKRRLTDRSKPSVPFKVIKDMKKRYDKIDKSKYNEYIFH